MIRHALGLGVLILTVAPLKALAVGIYFCFEAASGQVSIEGEVVTQPTASAMAGTFTVTAELDSYNHIGESDTFVPKDAYLTNTDALDVILEAGVITATLSPGSLKVLDFQPLGLGHFPTDLTVLTAVYIQATWVLELPTPYVDSTATVEGWVNVPMQFTMSPLSSATWGDVLSGQLSGSFPMPVEWPDAGTTMTLDMAISVEGTCLWLPEPALSGTTALGVWIAGVWLRRRENHTPVRSTP